MKVIEGSGLMVRERVKLAYQRVLTRSLVASEYEGRRSS